MSRFLVLAMVVLGSLGSISQAAPPLTADDVLQLVGAPRGIVVLLGDRDGRLATELAARSELTFYVPLERPEQVQAARVRFEARGLPPRQVCTELVPPGQIGLADNLADAVLQVATPWAVDRKEAERVLRPGGKSLLAGQTWTKPRPEGADDWPHHYRSPSNNPQSRDRLARAPYRTQFVAEPRYAPAPQMAVSAQGRLFMAFGQVAWHEREEPWIDTLLAVNAYNGSLLWRRALRPGIMVDRSTMIATPDTLYLADDQSCKLLDAQTGRQRDQIVVAPEIAGGTFWKWMALEGGVLYTLIGSAEPPDPVARWRSTRHGWPWTAISRGYNDKEYAWGFAQTLLAIDPKTKKVLWQHQEEEPIDGRSLCICAGRIYGCRFGRYLFCLDAKSGKPLWRRVAEKDAEVFDAIGPYRPGHGYVGGWKSTVYLKCTDKVLYFIGPQVEWLTALSADDGRVLWRHPAKDLHVVIRDEGLYVIGPQNSVDQTRKLDPLTGQVLATYLTHRRACTRSTGTADGILFRSQEGSGRFDVATGQMQWISPMRPSCHVGVVVANGLLYWVPWTCDCNLQLFGNIAFGPAPQPGQDRQLDQSQRLQTSPLTPHPLSLAPGDWPTYRADNKRSSTTDAKLPEQVAKLWELALPGGVEPTAPVAAGGLAVVAGSDGIVRGVDAATGQARWKAYTGGAVFYPPSIARDRAYVGSADGWAYCLDAATGRVAWRFCAAPSQRRIPLYGALVSTWPVASGVLVDNGVAYFAAGINDFDGTHVYALDADTGRQLWHNDTAGQLDEFSRRGVACQGEMLMDGGRLYLAGGNAASPGVFEPATGRCLTPPPTQMGSTAPRGRELAVKGKGLLISGQPLYSRAETPVYDPSVQWQPFVAKAGNADLTWEVSKEARPKAWRLVARKPEGGQLWQVELPGEPVRCGAAIDARGRVVLSLRDGKILCFGRK